MVNVDRPTFADIFPSFFREDGSVKTKQEIRFMPNRRNNSKKATAKSSNDERRWEPRVALWVADDDKSYLSSGSITFSRDQIEWLVQLFDDHAENHSKYGEQLRVRFFTYEPKNDSENGPDETGNLALTLVEKD